MARAPGGPGGEKWQVARAGKSISDRSCSESFLAPYEKIVGGANREAGGATDFRNVGAGDRPGILEFKS